MVNKARKFKQNPHGHKIQSNKLIRKGYRHNIIIKFFNMVFIGTNYKTFYDFYIYRENLKNAKEISFILSDSRILLVLSI